MCVCVYINLIIEKKAQRQIHKAQENHIGILKILNLDR